MRVSLIFTLLASLIGLTLGQTCGTNPTCPTTAGVAVPAPWFGLNFTTDPRLNPGVAGTTPLYSWQQQDANADGCAQYHSGLLVLPGSTTNTFDGVGPYVNLSTNTGAFSVGSTFPGLIGGAGSGSFALATSGWSFEVTFKTPRNMNWAKVYDLGQTKPSRAIPGDGRDCEGDIILGWSGGSQTMNFQTCVNGNSNTIGGNPQTLAFNTWYHIVAVLQQSPDLRSTYTVYINGAINSVSTQQQTIVQYFRNEATLGRSTWNDNYFNGTYDTFNIYDVALSPAQITSLYNAEMGGCALTRAANVAPTLPTTPPAPFFAAEFNTNISSATSVFGWVNQDAADVSCGIQTRHQGLLTLDGSGYYRPTFGPHVNLAATSGPNFAGVTMPTIGGVTANAGTVATLSAGFAIEVTYKPWFQNYGGKLINFGNTQNSTSGCASGDFWFGWNSEQLQFQLFVCGPSQISVFNSIGSGRFPVPLQTWNHFVVSFVAQTNNLATAYVYMNGTLAGVSQNIWMPQAIARANSFIGKSNFVGGDDTYFSGEIDHVRIYNQALNQAQVTNLTNTALYGSASTSSGVSTCPQVTNTATTVPGSALFYSAPFNTDPRSFAGGISAANYIWMVTDTNDTQASQAQHDGLILLGNGINTANPGRYVNFSAPSGNPASIGQPLGQVGGFGSGSYNAGTAGWTFEVEFRALPTPATSATANGMQWSKVFDLGNGNTGSGCYNDLVFGLVDQSRVMQFQTCHVQGSQQTLGTNNAFVNNFGTWYHVVISLQLVSGGSLASMYVNGTLSQQVTLGYYPLYAPRINAQLGKSSWPDQYFNGEVDMFNIYSQAVNQAQVSALYAASLLPFVPTSSSSSSSAAPTASSSSSAAPVPAASSSSSSAPVITPFFTSPSSSSAAVLPSSSSTGSVVVVASSSSSTGAVVPPPGAVSSSSSGNIFTQPSSSSAGAVSSGLVIPSSSSSTAAPAPGLNSASFTVPSLMILSVIGILVSLMF